MTGFAALRGEGEGQRWLWEMRAVNARGLDLRLRLPEGLDGLEQALRRRLSDRLVRGSVTVSLRLEAAGRRGGIDEAAVGATLAALARIEAQAREAGVMLAPPSAAEILQLRMVQEGAGETDEDRAALRAALEAQIAPLISAFDEMRLAEGKALAGVITGQLDRIAQLTDAAAEAAEARRGHVAATLKENVARLLDSGAGAGADPDRLAQELALLAVKADVTEEIDRLRAHVSAARALLEQGGAVGRKLDFLTQEFNREANTLCAKAGAAELTAIGLDLKAVIDQMREQVQNVE